MRMIVNVSSAELPDTIRVTVSWFQPHLGTESRDIVGQPVAGGVIHVPVVPVAIYKE
jgi:hypothetical protein